jgi:hypothetical protein
MSQKLSFSSIAATLAVLSASGLVACAGEATPPAASPADAKEVPAATTGSATAASDATAMKDEAKPLEGASATPAAEAPKPTADSPAPAAAATAPSGAAATPAKDDKSGTPAKKKHAGAKAGCGAGTCG